MARKIIRVGTSPNDGTGDSLRETANKVNFNFAELYTALGLDGCGNYSLNIKPPCGSDITLSTCGTGVIKIGDPNDPAITVPPIGSTAPVEIGTSKNPIQIGDPDAPSIVVPSPLDPAPVLKITPPTDGSIEIGNPTNPAITIPSDPTEPIEIGKGTQPIQIGDGNQPIKIGDPTDPSIEIPSDPTQPIQIGKDGQPIEFFTGRPPFEVLYTGADGKLLSDHKFRVDGTTLDVFIDGNLTVNGTTTTINSTTLTVDDKNIEIASTNSPSDALADGGGITLKGTTDKTIVWNLAKDRWVFNKGVDVVDAVVNNLTPNKFVKTDANKKLISDDITWDEIQPAPCAEDITIGHDCPGGEISIPAPGNGDPLKITNPDGPVEIGDDGNGNPGISVPPPGSNDPIKIGNPTAPGITVPPPGSNDPIKIGDPTNPSITVPKDPTQPVQIGKPGQPADVTTGLNKWELIYTGDDGKLDSSPFLRVTEDGEDSEGKSLHLHTALYDLGFTNTKLQSTIYFVDDVPVGSRGNYSTEVEPSKRAASLRFVKQPFGQGLIFSPWDNYNDTAFHDKSGIATWRSPINGLNNTKVTINDDGAGPGIHGLQIGRGAIGFFQDLEGGSNPDTSGLAYVILPGIPDGTGVNKVGQLFANPYRNRTEDGNSGVPYFGLGWKLSTQLIENGAGTYAHERAERTPGNEVLTWHTTNRVGVMNNNPNFTLSVTGDVAFTKTLRVGDAENPGTNGQVLTSTGSTTAPVWMTPADQRLSVVDDPNSNTTLKLMMTPETSGRINEAKIDSADLTYNPSTGTLSTPNLLVSASGVDFTGAVNALYYGAAANRVTLANYNVGGKLTFEVNGGAYTANFNADGTYEFTNLYAKAVGANAKPISVGSDGIIGYDDRIAFNDTVFDKGNISGSVTFDRNDGTIQRATAVGNFTVNLSNVGVGRSITMIITQDGTGGRTMTPPANMKFASGFKTLSTAAGAVDMMNIFYDGSTYYCTLTTGYA